MENDYSELKERVSRLELLVEELRSHRTAPPPPLQPPPVSRSRVAASASVRPATAPRPRESPDIRTLLRVVGIGLLLFGVVFLFKFSENEANVIRWIRVGVGISVGIGLALAGRVLVARDRPFAQVLTGGGIGVWYISGFAAYQLFGLTSAPLASAYMGLVTLVAFAISVRQDSVALTIVATLGGLATPFLLFDKERSATGVALYIVLVASGAVAIHVRRRWWPLLWVGFIASTAAWLATITYYIGLTTPDSQRWLLQCGILFLWGLFAVVAATSYARSVGTRPTHQSDDGLVLVTLIPIGTILLTTALWKPTQEMIGQMCVVAAFIYAAATLRTITNRPLIRLTSAHFLVSSAMLAVGVILIAHGETRYVALVAEALVLRFLCRRAQLPIASVASHGLFAMSALLIAADLMNTVTGTPVINPVGIATLWGIVGATLAALQLPRDQVRRFYFYCAHVAIMAWALRQLAPLANGQVIVTIIWGAYGAALLVTGLRKGIRPVRTVGLVTLFVVVGKLFMVDLVSVPAIWRVLLFIGFGGLFLALSYWFMSLDKNQRGRKQAESSKRVAGPGGE